VALRTTEFWAIAGIGALIGPSLHGVEAPSAENAAIRRGLLLHENEPFALQIPAIIANQSRDHWT
jgi:hypothetical protein